MARTTQEKQAAAKRFGEWTDTWGLEKNCANLLILGPRGKAFRTPSKFDLHAQAVVGTMKHRPVTTHGSFLGLSSTAFLVLANLHALYARQGYADNGAVYFSEYELRTELGLRGQSGLATIRRALSELWHGSFKGTIAIPPNAKRVQGELTALQRCEQQRDGTSLALLSELTAANLRDNLVTYVDPEIALSLKAADPLALRLWLFARAQDLKTGLFARNGLQHCIFEERYTAKNESLSISRLLSLQKWSREKAAERINSAAEVVNRIDPRYDLTVRQGKSWLLVYKLRSSEPSTLLSTLCSTQVSTLPSSHPSNQLTTPLSYGEASSATGFASATRVIEDGSTEEPPEIATPPLVTSPSSLERF